jgi:hypothetical protein
MQLKAKRYGLKGRPLASPPLGGALSRAVSPELSGGSGRTRAQPAVGLCRPTAEVQSDDLQVVYVDDHSHTAHIAPACGRAVVLVGASVYGRVAQQASPGTHRRLPMPGVLAWLFRLTKPFFESSQGRVCIVPTLNDPPRLRPAIRRERSRGREKGRLHGSQARSVSAC